VARLRGYTWIAGVVLVLVLVLLAGGDNNYKVY
jgi:hypothetical protein